jgi:hypothetical protein
LLAPMAIELSEWLDAQPEAPDLENLPRVGTKFSTPSPFAVKGDASRRSSRSMRQASRDEEVSI